MPRRLVPVALALGLLGAVSLPDPPAVTAAAAAPPAVTVTQPASGALLREGQPTFAGTASDGPTDTGRVVIDVYDGTGASSGQVPAEVLRATVVNGGWTATAVGLGDGTYTVVASEADTGGQLGSSQPVTFALANGTPELTLSGPAGPANTSTPTFTGHARTDPGDADTVALEIFPGTTTNATPVAVLSGPVAADGSFSIQVQPGLARGTYTVVATQQLVTHQAYSAPVTVSITVGRAALTVSAPAPGASEPQTGLLFSGRAGGDYGDALSVSLTLRRGPTAAGTPVGRLSVQRVGSSWQARWPTTLALGTYTLVVAQANVSGAVTQITRTFTVVAPGSLTGPVTVSSAGQVLAHLRCVSGAGTCVGDVLVLTAGPYAPVHGGPRGPLSLMFAHFSVPAGQTAALHSQLSAPALSALRRAGAAPILATVAYPLDGHLTEVTRRLAPVRVR